MACLPVIHRLRAAHPAMQCILTHTSPSVGAWSFDGIDRADFLPLDEPAHVLPVLDALRPEVMVFSRGDLWPELIRAASEKGIPIAVTGGTISRGSGRLRWPVRSVLYDAARRVDYLGAVSIEDAGRWRRLGARPETLRVSGDPRHDFVLERPADATLANAIRRWAGADPVLVAGSVEPSDVAPLVTALSRVVRAMSLRVVLVPHRAQDALVARIERRLAAAGLETGRWDTAGADRPARPPPPQPQPQPQPASRIVVVTSVGHLFDLYLAADLAYVGGGYGSGGLHAVIEPAAFAVPVVVGPRWRSDADVATLVACGGAAAPADRSPEALSGAIDRWLRNPEMRREAGLAARRTLAPGAAQIDAGEIGELIRRVRGAR